MYSRSDVLSEPPNGRNGQRSQDLEARLKQYKDYAESTQQLNEALNKQVKACYSRIQSLSQQAGDAKEQLRIQVASMQEAEKRIQELGVQNKTLRIQLAKYAQISQPQVRQIQKAVSLGNSPVSCSTANPQSATTTDQMIPADGGPRSPTSMGKLNPQILNLQLQLEKQRQQRVRLEKVLKHKDETLQATMFEIQNNRRKEQQIRSQQLQHFQTIQKELEKYRELESHFGKQADIIRAYQINLANKNDQINQLQTQINDLLLSTAKEEEQEKVEFLDQQRLKIQVEALRDHVENLHEQMQRLRRQQAQSKTETLILQSQLDNKTEEAERLRKLVNEREQVIQQQLKEIQELTVQQTEGVGKMQKQYRESQEKWEEEKRQFTLIASQNKQSLSQLQSQNTELKQYYNNQIQRLNDKIEEMNLLLLSEKKVFEERNSQIFLEQSQLFSAMSETEIKHNQELEKLKSENKKLLNELSHKSTLILEFNRKMESMMKELEELEQESSQHREVQETLKRTQEQMHYIKAKMEDNKHIITQMNDLQRENTRFKEAVATQERMIEDLQEHNDNLKEAIASLQHDLEKSTIECGRVAGLKSELLALKLEYSNSLKENNSLVEINTRLEKKRNEMAAQLERLRRDRQVEMETFDELSKIKSQLQVQLMSCYQQIDALNKVIVSKEEDAAALRVRLEAAMRRQQLYSSGSPSMRREAGSIEPRVRSRATIIEQEDVPVRDRSGHNDHWQRMQAKIQNLKSQNESLKKGFSFSHRKH